MMLRRRRVAAQVRSLQDTRRLLAGERATLAESLHHLEPELPLSRSACSRSTWTEVLTENAPFPDDGGPGAQGVWVRLPPPAPVPGCTVARAPRWGAGAVGFSPPEAGP